jgi:nucleotide-binding universal stress UspA family protein
MQRFENILLLHDRASRGRKALRRATELARRNGARLKIVEVVDAPTGPQRTMQTTSGEVDLVEVITRDRLAALDRRAEAIAAEGVEVSTRVLYGSPFLAVIKEVLQGAHDLVMLTTEGEGGLRAHLFGSTSRHLLRKCPCPVWVVRPSRRRKGLRVLAAVNPAEESDTARALDRKIMEMASSLARMDDGQLDVVHVWQAVPRSASVSSQSLARWNAEIMAAAEARLQDVISDHDLDDLAPRLHLPGGPPGLKIAEVAADRRIDVVVMGTLSRTGLKGLLIGNTCETALQYLDTSLLAVKPAGFVSPVEPPRDAP